MSRKALSQIKFRFGFLGHFNQLFIALAALLLLANRTAKAQFVFTWLYFGIFVVGLTKLLLKPDKIQVIPGGKATGFPLLGLIVLLTFFAPFFLNPLNTAQDWIFPSQPMIKAISLIPSVWESHLGGADLGHSQGYALWLLPVWSVISLATRLLSNYSWTTKFFTALFLFGGFIGIRHLLSSLKLSSLPIFIGSIFYLVNTYTLTLLDGGNLFIFFAYCLFPGLVYQLYSPLRKSTIRLGVLLSVICLLDFRFLIIFAITGLCSLSPQLVKKGLTAMLLSLSVHSFWVLPAITKIIQPDISYSNISQVDQFSLSSTGHLLFFSQPHWFTNNFGDIQPVRWFFFPVAALGVFALTHSTTTSTRFLTAIFMAGLFLAKGTHPPLGQIYTFAYNHLPFFTIFRDPSKFTALLALGFSGLIATGLHTLSPRLRQLAVVLVLLYFVGLAIPIYSNSLSGAFATHPFQATYSKLAAQIESATFGRILWIPAKPPPAWVNRFPIHTETTTLLSKQPYRVMVDGAYELSNYLRTPGIDGLLDISGITYLAYPYPGDRKQELKPDQVEYYYWYTDWLKSQPWLTDNSPSMGVKLYSTRQSVGRLFSPEDIALVVGTDNIYKFFSNFPNFRLRDHLMVHRPNLALPPAYDNLIFYDATPLDLAFVGVDKSRIFRLSHLVPRSGRSQGDWWSRSSADYLFVKDYLAKNYALNFSDHDLDMGYLIAEGEHELAISGFPQTGDLYLRILKNRAGGSVEVINGQENIFVDTWGQSDNFSWVKVGPYVANTPLRFYSKGQLNLLNSAAVVTAEQVSKLLARSLQQISDSNVVQISTPGIGENSISLISKSFPQQVYLRIPPTTSSTPVDLEVNTVRFTNTPIASLQAQWLSLPAINQPEQSISLKATQLPTDSQVIIMSAKFQPPNQQTVNYSQDSQTKYHFQVTSPGPLVFSESFDPNWKINPGNLTPFPAYDMLNGYYINSPGTYTLDYAPQQIIAKLFILSLIIFIILVFFAFLF